MIKKIYFENFKSFAKTEMLVENITTLIGTNASGKTNMMEGMKILSELMFGRDLSSILDGTKNSVSGIRGGAKGCCRLESDYFVLGCTVVLDEETDLEYRVKIEVKDRIIISYESLSTLKNKKNVTLFVTKEVEKESDDIKVSYDNGKKGRNPEIICIRSASVISQLATKLPQDTKKSKRIVEYVNIVRASFKDVLYLNMETNQMRGYSNINDIELKVNASNLSSVLYELCKDDDNKRLLLSIMRELPENQILDIIFTEGPLNDVILFLSEQIGRRVEKIDATRLSDGTLRCLAIVAAILSEKKGGLIAVEEIGNGIHPGRAKKLIRLVSQVVRERGIDIILTTHNAILLNALDKHDLEGVQVVYRDEEEGDARFISLIDIHQMPALLANGKLGDVFTNDMILKYIKLKDETTDYAWLEV